MLRRADATGPNRKKQRPPGKWCRVRALCVALPLALVPATQAQVENPQRAIEKLEACSEKERKSGCINILKRQPQGNGRQAVKAQVRGGRIIWYEYDTRSGKVRRTN